MMNNETNGVQDFTSDNENTPLQTGNGDGRRGSTVTNTKEWNIFRDPPIIGSFSSITNHKFLEVALKIIKVLVYFILFFVVLGSSIIAKGTILLMTSQLRVDRTVSYCNRWLGQGKIFTAKFPEEHRIAWIWCVIFAFTVPEVLTLIRCFRICIFKTWRKPRVEHFMFVLLMETFHVVGLALMFMSVLPDVDVVQGVMLTSCVCFVPGLLNLLSRNKKSNGSKGLTLILVDVAALTAQATAFVVWPLLNSSKASLWLAPLALILVSCGWWENYVCVQSPLVLMTFLGEVKQELKSSRYFTYVFVSAWKISIFFFSSMIILHLKGNTVTQFFALFGNAFSDHYITVTQIQSTVGSADLPIGATTTLIASSTTPIWVLLIQLLGAYLAYTFGTFACKILMQEFSYALPVHLTIPVSISLLIAGCALRNEDPCAFHGVIPDYLFFEAPLISDSADFISKEYDWIWLLWLFSQTWITLHIWSPNCERLASTDKLFVSPMYNGLLVDQSMGLNRSRDDHPEVTVEDLIGIKKTGDSEDNSIGENANNTSRPASTIKKSDLVTKIYACATMWHETRDEMSEFVKSILRLDLDQCTRPKVENFLKIVDPDYYELETHIFFDDAFEISDHDENEWQVNEFVKLLVDVLDQAATDIHDTQIHLKAPKKYPTPYGGRLVWTLPGNTKMIAHLKDKSKIRHRKRWSQVMYMYYFLGHRIMDQPISISRKELISQNTYLLALDGDIDFQPSAVQVLVDLMKKNQNLGAACGRIHPVGSGPMVWYQMFEYAIGHWLQKATEHMIGCVLCSPGCFSLFRAKALMDDNVLKKYTSNSNEAKHYLQYDQGEDRWLCTLLLQRGYRVEYSAASDAYTHAPEGFNEFYNQRRRWVPSTMANIMDLIANSEHTVKNNDNISKLYMVYQVLLLVGTILAPGTIFLILIGAFVSAFDIGLTTSLYCNIIPIVIFVVACFVCKSEVQLLIAAVISTVYGLAMIAVLFYIVINMVKDGLGAPASLFFTLIVCQVVVAGLMHPQELMCLPCGLIYYISIPSMHMLLMIYSITNLYNVTWGTREVPVKKTLAELKEEQKEADEVKQKRKRSFLSFLQDHQDSDEGDQSPVELLLAGLCKCIPCVPENTSNKKQQLDAVAECVEQVMKRLDTIENGPKDPQVVASGSNLTQENSVHVDRPNSDADITAIQATTENGESTILMVPYWLNDEGLKKGEVEYLSARETQFWEDLIVEYLLPIDEDEREKARIAGDLKILRNNSTFAFFMLNALFVLVVFIMQLNEDLFRINWPFGIKYRISYETSTFQVHTTNEYLELEPIGLVFIVFFGVILVIQFVAMLFHRLGTFGHILASTTLLGSYCCKKPEDLSQEVLPSEDAIEVAKDLQRLDTRENDRPKGRKSRKVKSNLDVTFREKFLTMKKPSKRHTHGISNFAYEPEVRPPSSMTSRDSDLLHT